ncbi:hypothetical protein BC826DRAFT_1068851, partial [Russula brevipes]
EFGTMRETQVEEEDEGRRTDRARSDRKERKPQEPQERTKMGERVEDPINEIRDSRGYESTAISRECHY